MSQNQAILAVSLLASQGSLAKVQDFIKNYQFSDKALILGIILLFTPEIEPASNLTFVQEFLSDNSATENQDVVIELISEDSNLVELVEVGPEILTTRVTYLKAYVTENSAALGLTEADLVQFVKARVRKTFIVNPDIHFNDPLFKLVSENSQFKLWRDNSVVPYEYLNHLSNSDITLLQFEELPEVERLKTLLDALEVAMISKVDRPLISFIQSSSPGLLIEYLEKYPPSNVRTLQLLNRLIVLVFPEYESKDILIKQSTSTLYEFPELSKDALESISDVLGVFQQYSNDEFLINLIKLTSAARVINYEDGSLEKLDQISKDPKLQQTLLHTVLENIDTNTSKEFINQLYVLRQTIFTSIDFQEYNSQLVQKLLSLKLYSLVAYKENYEDLIVDYFWRCFKRASNGSRHRGEMLNASRTLELISNPSPRVQSLKNLIEAIDELSSYSLYFKPGTPVVPADFLAVSSIEEVIKRVLELNPYAYLESDKLLNISTGLTEGLDLQPIDTFQLNVFCIESALVNNDFEFALTTANNLLDNTKDQSKLEQTWLTFFQVGKYVSPEWLDTEAPEDSVKGQLDLLAKVLKICPVKNNQVIIAQWSSLDLELSLR